MMVENTAYKIQVGDVLKGKRTSNIYDVVSYVMNDFAGHGIYTLVCRKTKESRTVADFVIHRKFVVV